MIVLLGSSGYFGRAFAAELRRRGQSFIPLTRRAFDYTRLDYLFDYLRTMKPAFLINAAGYSCRPEEDGLEAAREILAADPNARIVMVTALGQEKMLLDSIALGVRDFVVKPFTEERILSAVEKALH